MPEYKTLHYFSIKGITAGDFIWPLGSWRGRGV